MKIYQIELDKELQPTSQHLTYPIHNIDWGVEQDFNQYIQRNKDKYLISDPNMADLHYLPVYWTRWHLNHEYGTNGLNELKNLVNKSLIDDSKTFTICQYDDGPKISLGKSQILLSSRNSNTGVDIPLLCSPHTLPILYPKKKFRASFVGRLSTHPLRNQIRDVFKDNIDYYIVDSENNTKKFVKKILQSYVVLAPRGYGGSSFRFYEAMQLGVVPMLIGDIDTRPFKSQIDWNSISFYAKSAREAKTILDKVSLQKLLAMGAQCKKIYNKYLRYQKWCEPAINELGLHYGY